MCNEACIEFAIRVLGPVEIVDRDVLEVGSYDTTGTVRPHLAALGPASYLGVDIVPGPSVDAICNVYDLEATLGRETFDVVITTEMVEHVRDWRRAFSNMKAVLRPGGLLVVTTRSRGFRYHFGPRDFWRYEVEDMERIAADMDVIAVERDPIAPGVFLAARKRDRSQIDLSEVELYSMVKRRRVRDVTDRDIQLFEWTTPLNLARRLLPQPVRRRLKRLVEAATGREI